LVYRLPAASGWGLTAAERRLGRIIAKPARKTQYAARIPNAIEPIEAQTSITKFSPSSI
jgi:hypothetical protein